MSAERRRSAWPRRRRPCTAGWTWHSRGRRPTCRSGSGRSTSIASTRTSASSCRSSSRRSSSATSCPGGHVLDPFAGSGTTLVQALESGRDATGVDIAGFNCLLMRVKTRRHNLDADPARSPVGARAGRGVRAQTAACRTRRRPYVRDWYAPRAAAELLHFRSLVDQVASADVLRVILARAARSARRTTHFDLDFPREPQVEPYWCHKHRRTCRPVEEARRFLLRYTTGHARPDRDVRGGQGGRRTRVRRARRRARARPRRPVRRCGHVAAVPGADRLPRAAPLRVRAARPRRAAGGRARTAARGASAGRRSTPTSRASRACSRTRERRLAPGAPVCIVVNDRRDLYPEVLRRAGLRLDDRLERHVNRRTGRRAGEYFESVLVCRAS